MQKRCANCDEPVDAARSTRKYCGPQCRSRAYERRRSGGSLTEPSVTEMGAALVAAVRAELAALGLEASALGIVAVLLAERLGTADLPGQAAAVLSKEFRATLIQAQSGAVRRPIALDELRQRRASQFSDTS